MLWGWIADRIGRRKVFIGTVLNFSIATGLLYFTPDNGWIYLTVMRFFVGVGVGGLYCVDLPLVQEFMPTSKRGFIGGLVTRRHPARRRPRRRAGRLHAERPVAPAVRHRPPAGSDRPAGAAVGAGIAALAGAPGPLRGGAQVARLGAAGPARIAALAGRGDVERRARQDQLVRSLQVSAQPAGVVARQCRRADRRLWRGALGAVAVRAAAEGDAAGSRQDDDPAERHRLPRPPVLLLALREIGRRNSRRPAGLRRRRPDHPGRLQLQHPAVRACRPSG